MPLQIENLNMYKFAHLLKITKCLEIILQRHLPDLRLDALQLH